MKVEGRTFTVTSLASPRRASPTARVSGRVAVLLLLSFTFLLLSPSAAASWVKQRSGTMSWLRSVFFLDESRGWAAGGRGVLLATSDGGATWEPRPAISKDSLRDLFFVDERTGWLLCEADAYAPRAEARSRSYLLKTTDGGATWTRSEVAGADALFVRVAFADSSRGWLLGEAGTLYATADGGATWARQSVPTRHLLLGAHFLDARHGWVVGAGSTALYTADGGATWRAGRVHVPADTAASSVLVREDTHGVFASTSSSADDETTSAAPKARKAPTTNTSPASVRLHSVSFVDERRGWAVGVRGAIYATVDGGRNWLPQRSGVRMDLFDVKFFDAREGRAVGSGGTVLHTKDGGASWTAEDSKTPHQLERLFFVGRSRGWAVGFGGTVISFRPATATPPKLRGAS